VLIFTHNVFDYDMSVDTQSSGTSIPVKERKK
jgi:hypothetical protein